MTVNRETLRIYRMIANNAKLAEFSKTTHDDSEGSARAVQQFNIALKRLEELRAVPEGFFAPIEEGASWGDIFTASSHVCAYLEPDIEEPASAAKGVEKVDFRPILTLNSPDSRAVGDILREIAPDVIKDLWKQNAEETEEAGEESEPTTTLDAVESKIAELGAQMQVLSQRLRRNDLSTEEVARLADELESLGKRQAQLARKHAGLRETEED